MIVRAGWDQLSAEHQRVVEPLAARFARSWAASLIPGPPTVLHNDFHTWNMVFTPPGPVSELAGIWDFSCVETGESTFDLRYLPSETSGMNQTLPARMQRATSTS